MVQSKRENLGEAQQTTTFDDDASHGRAESRAHSEGSDENGKKKISPPTWKTYVTIAVSFAAYIGLNILGGLIFQVIEKKQSDGTLHPITSMKAEFVRINRENLTIEALNAFLQDIEDVRDEVDGETIPANLTLYANEWTLNQAFLLSFTIASTIGYGVLTPRTDGGQLFAVFFALIGIPFTGLLAAKLGSVLAYFIKKAATFIFKGRKSNRWIRITSILFTFLVGLLIYVIVPALVLAYGDSGEKWTFVESFYCIFITLTTIGFGDYVPDPHASFGMAGNILVLIWVVAGLAWVATIINLIANVISKQATSIKRKVANQHISIKTLKSGAAVLGGHRLTRKFKLKSSNDSLEKGSCEICDENSGQFFDKEIGAKPHQSSPVGSKEHLTSEKDSDSSESSPPSVPLTSDEARRESKSSRREDTTLGPSGLMSVVVNNMEMYESSELIGEDPT